MRPQESARFRTAVEALPSSLYRLLMAPAAPRKGHGPVPKVPGVYLFSANGEALYVGQTRNLRRRLADHTRPSSGHESASLAFRLAERWAKEARLEVVGSRAKRVEVPAFRALFDRAKAQVSEWDVQFVEIEDEIVRTLFEVYAALALDTVSDEGFNSFETH